MPIYELHYQTYDGPRRGAISRWFAIARFAWMGLLGRRAIVWLFTISWLQFLVRGVLLYLLSNENILKALVGRRIDINAIYSIDASFFKSMIDWQLVFCFLFVFILGSGLISQDLAHNALVLFAAKPISRLEYILGKFATVFLLLMSLTWLQTIALFVMQWAICPAGSKWAEHFWTDYFWLIVPITLYSVVLSASLSLLILTFSSLTRNGRYAGVAFAATLIGTAIVAGLLQGEVGALWFIRPNDWYAISLIALAREIGDYLFKMPGSAGIGATLAWTAMGSVWLACTLILKVRLNQSASKGA